METRTLLATLTMLATLAVGAPAAIAAPQPAASASPMSEQALFQRLRALPFFAGMTDEQLRAQPLPPGFKSWQEFLAAHEQLNAPTPKATPRPQPAADAPNLARDRQLIDRAEAGDAAAQAQLGIWSLYGRGTLIPLDVKVGDRILFGKYAGTEVEIKGVKHLIIRESELLGILEG